MTPAVTVSHSEEKNVQKTSAADIRIYAEGMFYF